MKKYPIKKEQRVSENNPLPGSPAKSAGEDIYDQDKKETFNEEGLPVKPKKKPAASLKEELDIPGTELDDANEIIGEEDEENNYYSLGGESHHNLDENNGE